MYAVSQFDFLPGKKQLGKEKMDCDTASKWCPGMLNSD